jgi:oxygen-independent coproporphyrinogen-3 oxidase
VRRAIELQPDSVTIYQMELPYKHHHLAGHSEEGRASPIAGWDTKRGWLNYAFDQFLAHDYEIAGTDIVATKKKTCRFIYRDAPLARRRYDRHRRLIVFAFRRRQFQNAHNFEEYVRILNEDRLPLLRGRLADAKAAIDSRDGFAVKDRSHRHGYFQKKYGVDVWNEFRPVYERLEEKVCSNVKTATSR